MPRKSTTPEEHLKHLTRHLGEHKAKLQVFIESCHDYLEETKIKASIDSRKPMRLRDIKWIKIGEEKRPGYGYPVYDVNRRIIGFADKWTDGPEDRIRFYPL